MLRRIFEWFFPIEAENKRLADDINKLEGQIKVLPDGRVIRYIKKPAN